ncbi:hypothetical protein BD414DRAFT_272940 [Trametes punicea]|nr:hypothetical protein BD414DRAFT_272940 [Trametes punicea]
MMVRSHRAIKSCRTSSSSLLMAGLTLGKGMACLPMGKSANVGLAKRTNAATIPSQTKSDSTMCEHNVLISDL